MDPSSDAPNPGRPSLHSIQQNEREPREDLAAARDQEGLLSYIRMYPPIFVHIPLLTGTPHTLPAPRCGPQRHREVSFPPPYFLAEAPSECETHPVGFPPVNSQSKFTGIRFVNA